MEKRIFKQVIQDIGSGEKVKIFLAGSVFGEYRSFKKSQKFKKYKRS